MMMMMMPIRLIIFLSCWGLHVLGSIGNDETDNANDDVNGDENAMTMRKIMMIMVKMVMMKIIMIMVMMKWVSLLGLYGILEINIGLSWYAL